ncbi:pectate lyase [Amphibacillus sp. MSJ-3]|uniref:pectate lyase n=1 Tax=Amphibacillus sp. MSJ-3 TaxID=2841505 RepID=UPI001C0F0A43|nr:pectate lyase [Amphibacillus sp. MSJ-3]MBU5593925.1 pectate lyase [Amphibacillus sp. MSJ-3]
MKRFLNVVLSFLLVFTATPINMMVEAVGGKKLYNQPAIYTEAGDQEVTLNWIKPIAKGKKMLFVGAGLPADDKTIQYLETLGFSTIDFADANEVKTEDAEGYDLVFVGESSSSSYINQKFLDLPIPVIYSKGWVLDKVYLSSGELGKYGDLDNQTALEIKDPQHPLSAGLDGRVEVYSESGKMNFGTPSEEATVIATIEGKDEHASIFAYDKGAKDVRGNPVPARRVSTFLFAGQEDEVTQEGWELIKAAVIWALGLEDEMNTSNETYRIQRATTSGGPYEEIATVNDTTYHDTDLENNITYYYLVTLVTEQVEYEVFPEISATPVVPLNAPNELKAVAGNGEVEISWDPVDGATSYLVKRSIDGDIYETVGDVTDTKYIDYEVENETTYHYIILAKNDVTSSEASDPVSVTPVDTSPIITLDQEATSYVNKDTFTISGSLDREATIFINNQEIELQPDLSFSSKVTLDIGENLVSITAVDGNGEQRDLDITVIYDNQPPLVNLDEIDGELNDGIYKTKYNPLPISGSISEKGYLVINGEEVDLTDDLNFDTSIDLDPEEVNHISIKGVDLAGNESETINIKVLPDKNAVPKGPIKIVKSIVKEPNMIELTFNGKIEHLDPNDLELLSAMGDWEKQNPNLTANFNILNTEVGTNAQSQTTLTIEVEETFNMDGTVQHEIEEDPHKVPYLRASYYSDDLEKSIEQADNLLTWQMDHGGWAKNKSDNDYTRPWDGKERKSESYSFIHDTEAGTIDNDATVDEILFLALMYKETGKEEYKEASLRGIHYILESQYDTGGFPQVYPLVGGYPDAVTFNDNAMVRVLNALTLISEKKYPFNSDLVSDDLIDQVNQSLDAALEYILNAQIEVDGRLTAWGQQHDPVTYEPVLGRAYELPSITANESIGIVKYLMSLPDQSPEVKTAIKSALDWYEEVKVEGVKYISGDPENQYFYDDPDSTMWYRYYEIGTNKPIFSGRDGVKKYDLMEVEEERRNGYQWAGDYGSKTIEIANTTAYYQDRAYVKVVNNNSYNAAGETLEIGELSRIEAYDDSENPDIDDPEIEDPNIEDPKDPADSEGTDDQEDQEDPGKKEDPQESDGEPQQNKKEDPRETEKENIKDEASKLPKTATSTFNFIIGGILILLLGGAIALLVNKKNSKQMND